MKQKPYTVNVEINVIDIVPHTENITELVIGQQHKSFTLHVDKHVGAAISLFKNEVQKPRPFTHDLFANSLLALGAKVERAMIDRYENGIYFARLILTDSNRQYIEVDARPSDSIAMALQQRAPIYINSELLDVVADISDDEPRELLDQDEEQAA